MNFTAEQQAVIDNHKALIRDNMHRALVELRRCEREGDDSWVIHIPNEHGPIFLGKGEMGGTPTPVQAKRVTKQRACALERQGVTNGKGDRGRAVLYVTALDLYIKGQETALEMFEEQIAETIREAQQ